MMKVLTKKTELTFYTEKKVIVWGCGLSASSLLPLMKQFLTPVACCDNNAERWGSEFQGIPVIPPHELEVLLKEEGENILIQLAVITQYEENVCSQLENMGALYVSPLKTGNFLFVHGSFSSGKNLGTIQDLKSSFCSGCSACESVCPTKAITLTPNEEGYFTPLLQEETCIHCEKCKDVCPVIHPVFENTEHPLCYAFMGEDSLRMESSSGGVFTLLATEILAQGGVVCGVVLTDKFQVEHKIIESVADLALMRGSKYVQSDLNHCFPDIKESLKSGQKVLFTGTPCQVAGLYNFLGKPYENLYTLDLLCHGSPSSTVFEKYLSDYYGLDNLKGFQFRTKKFGYNCVHQIATLKDGSEKVGHIDYDAYEKIMHSGLSLHDICKYCIFAPTPRQGDISIGDFWGIHKHDPALNDNKGTSLILVNNEKGKALFAQVTPQCKVLESVPLDFALQNNRFGQNMTVPSGKERFYQLMKEENIDKATEFALKDKYDVGVVGVWDGRNYGSMITYYALHHVLTEMGLSVLMIKDINPTPKRQGTNRSHAEMVSDEFYQVSEQYTLETIHEVNAHCDTFLLGSDQLWNIYLSRAQGDVFYLGFVEENKKKISYATSAGDSFHGTEKEKLLISKNLQRFDHISVRDEMGLEICKESFGVEAVKTCDPTFLCKKEVYPKLAERSTRHEEGAYILAFILNPTPEFGATLEKLTKETGKKVIVVLDEPPMNWEKNKEKLGLSEDSPVIVKELVNLYQWLWYYEHCDAVVTDSFHGSIFSMIFQKPFITRINRPRGGERFIALFKDFDISSRLFEHPEDMESSFSMLEKMDFAPVNEKIKEITEFSRNWLKEAIFAEKK